MTVKINGNEYEALRINKDVNGNPRYVVHFTAFITREDEMAQKVYDISALYIVALTRAKKIGGKKYHTKSYGGGIVFQSYNLQADMDKIVF